MTSRSRRVVVVVTVPFALLLLFFRAWFLPPLFLSFLLLSFLPSFLLFHARPVVDRDRAVPQSSQWTRDT